MAGTVYVVTYASAGCLPDTDEDPPFFDSLADAAQYVADEYVMAGGTLDYTNALATAIEDDGLQDPRPGSLYRWSIEEHGFA